MSYLIANQSGNFEQAGLWSVAADDAGAVQQNASGYRGLTTSWLWSSLFTLSNRTVDAVLVMGRRYGDVSSGQVEVALSNNGGSSISQIQTLPVTGLAVGRSQVLVQFPSSQTYNSGQMALGLRCTESSRAIFYYQTGTSSNWTRLVRTTQTAAATTDDLVYISGPWTGPATGQLLTVEYNSFRTTGTIASLEIGLNGCLNVIPVSGQTVQFLVQRGVQTYARGQLWWGPVQGGQLASFASGSTLIWTHQFGAAVLRVWAGGEWRAYSSFGPGPARAFLACPLPTDGTVLTLDTTVRWAAGQQLLLVAGTAATHSWLTVAQDVVDRSIVTVTSPVTMFYGGGSAFPTPVLNMSRNLIYKGRDSAAQIMIDLQESTTVHLDGVEFRHVGYQSDRGVRAALGWGLGCITLERCVFRDSNSYGTLNVVEGFGGFSIEGSESQVKLVARHNNFYNCYGGLWVTLATTTLLSSQVDLSSNSFVLNRYDPADPRYNLVLAHTVNIRGSLSYGSGGGLLLQQTQSTSDQANNLNNLTLWHGEPTVPTVQIAGQLEQGRVLAGWSVGHRGGPSSVVPAIYDTGSQIGVTFRDGLFSGRYNFGGSGPHIWLFGTCQFGVLSDSVAGIVDPGLGGQLVLDQCVATGLGTWPLVQCTALSGWLGYSQILARSCTLGGSLLTSGPLMPRATYYSWRESSDELGWTVWTRETVRSSSSAVVRSSPRSERVQLRSGRTAYSGLRAAPYSQLHIEVKVWVYKSNLTGESYSGNAPALVVRPDPSRGLRQELALATLPGTVTNGVWYQLIGTLRTTSTLSTVPVWNPTAPTQARFAVRANAGSLGSGAFYLDDWDLCYFS